MRVREAREVARSWVEDQVSAGSALDAAFLHGSVTWLKPEDEMAAASDVDVLIVPKSGANYPARGKHLVAEVALDVSTIDRAELARGERMLCTYHLAGSLRSPESILYDPDGWLSGVQRTVGAGFAEPRWVHARCDHAVHRIERNLRNMEVAETPEVRTIGWLFAVGVTTHVLLVAGLRNPTVRNRYVAVRTMLEELGRPKMYPPLIDGLDPRNSGPDQVMRYLDALEPVFDSAVETRRTWFHFAEDLSPAGRLGAIDAARELAATGSHREALFWTGVTAARCAMVLNTDHDDSRSAPHNRLLADLNQTLGIANEHDAARQILVLRRSLPDLRSWAEVLIEDRRNAKRPRWSWRRGRSGKS